MKVCLRCGLLAVAFALQLLCFAESSVKGTVYFLNVPETVKTPGTVHVQVLRSGEKARVFWHYKNATGKPQKFTLTASGDASGLRSGYHVSAMPGIAGTEAMYAFLTSQPTDGAKLDLSIDVPNGKVVSGVAEGNWPANSALTASMGSGMEVPGIKTITSPHLVIEKACSLDKPGKTIKVRVCGEQAGHIAGDYGSTYNIVAESKLSKKATLKVVFSPRGGEASCIYAINGKVVKTPLVGAKKSLTLFAVPISKGEKIAFSFWSVGGFNYPVEFRLSAK